MAKLLLRVKADGANLHLPRGKAVDIFKAGKVFEVSVEEHKRLMADYSHIVEETDAIKEPDAAEIKASIDKMDKWTERLKGMKKEAMQELCKKRGLKVDGQNVAAMISALESKPED